jgi:hypothetical protein
MKRCICWIAVCGSLMVALAVWSSRAGEPAPIAAPAEGKELDGKWLAVDLDRALDRHATWLHNANVRSIGGEPFVVGTAFSMNDEGKAEDHITMCIALRHIEQIYVFENLEDLKKIYGKQ